MEWEKPKEMFRDDFPCDTGLQFAEFRDKEEVKEAIRTWLTDLDHPDDQVAQNLYIGSHGNRTGLFHNAFKALGADDLERIGICDQSAETSHRSVVRCL